MGGPGSGGNNRLSAKVHNFKGTLRKDRHLRRPSSKTAKARLADIQKLRAFCVWTVTILTERVEQGQTFKRGELPKALAEIRKQSALLVVLDNAIGRLETQIADDEALNTPDEFGEFLDQLERGDAAADTGGPHA